jgi:hypothetical protein
LIVSDASQHYKERYMLKTWTGGLPARKVLKKVETERAEVDLLSGLWIGHPFMEIFGIQKSVVVF